MRRHGAHNWEHVGHLTALAAVKALSDMVEAQQQQQQQQQQQLWTTVLPPDTMRLISAGHRYLARHLLRLQICNKIEQYGRARGLPFSVAQVIERDESCFDSDGHGHDHSVVTVTVTVMVIAKPQSLLS
jgi:hypothetical protein